MVVFARLFSRFIYVIRSNLLWFVVYNDPTNAGESDNESTNAGDSDNESTNTGDSKL